MHGKSLQSFGILINGKLNHEREGYKRRRNCVFITKAVLL
jgi:hypothetical protein